jgi:hypothetical protein
MEMISPGVCCKIAKSAKVQVRKNPVPSAPGDKNQAASSRFLAPQGRFFVPALKKPRLSQLAKSSDIVLAKVGTGHGHRDESVYALVPNWDTTNNAVSDGSVGVGISRWNGRDVSRSYGVWHRSLDVKIASTRSGRQAGSRTAHDAAPGQYSATLRDDLPAISHKGTE